MSDELIPGQNRIGTSYTCAIPDTAEEYFRMAFEFQDQGMTEQALVCFKEVIGIVPDYTPALHEIGNCLNNLGRHEEAAEYYNRALQEIGDRLNTIARQEEALGRYWQAISWYEESGPYYVEEPGSREPETSHQQNRRYTDISKMHKKSDSE